MKHWLLPQASLDVVKFTVTPTASAKTITLDGLTAPFGCVVDWGDGAFSPLTSNAALSHTYTDTTSRQIVLRGLLGGFWNTGSSTGKPLVLSLDEITSRSLVMMQNVFRGCTSIRTLPQSFDAPNLTNCNYAFYQCRSITSNLPLLWQTNTAASHSGCFTDCCKSFYGQYSTGCPYRQYVAAVQGQTYYQKYGQSGCPAASYHAGVPYVTYMQHFGGGSRCPAWTAARCTGGNNHSACISTGGGYHPSCTCPGGVISCEFLYSGSPSYYSCSYFGGTCKTSGCTRTYQSGQSAYYRCTRSGGTCTTSSCPYPYANESSYNTARSNGWA